MKTANGILKISIGISLFIFSLAALNLSISKANAAPPKPAQFMEEGTNKIGKYMITLAAAPGDPGKMNWTAVLWDTETGISHTYTEQTNDYSRPSFNTSGDDAK